MRVSEGADARSERSCWGANGFNRTSLQREGDSRLAEAPHSSPTRFRPRALRDPAYVIIYHKSTEMIITMIRFDHSIARRTGGGAEWKTPF